MKRYSHTAFISIEKGGSLINGEWVDGAIQPDEIVQGQYFSDNNGQMKVNVDGDEKIVQGQFFTQHKPIKDAKRIRIDNIALDAKILRWEPFQSHSVIYV